jgi:hypothetical protein
MLQMYIKLLGGSTEAAAVAYLAVEVQSAKIAMINAVAKDHLEANTTIFSLQSRKNKSEIKGQTGPLDMGL